MKNKTGKSKFNFNKIERKWQKEWAKKKIFQVKDNIKGKEKFYVLEMFPYPSGSGLHMGHAFNYTIGDIYARFKRMNNFNVLYPMGYDSLGLPAENAAIKAGQHPKKFTENAIKNFIKQQKSLGLGYDWSRIVKTHDSNYYKWDQWIFLKMFEKGLAYRKKAPVNWCKKCKTVLANEQVHNGKCWRHEDTEVEIKHLEQWFFKITKYADELLKDAEKLKWPERIKIMQKNWIGKSYGTEIMFEVETPDNIISNVVIVHGSPSKDRTKEKGYIPHSLNHWFPWLKRELEKRGIKTITPEMPTAWAPKYDEWKSIMDKLIVNENTILIGHSAGGAFLVRWLAETGKKIKKLILVSPGKAGHESNHLLNNFYASKADLNIKNNFDKLIIFTADDDISYHIPNAYEYQKELGGKLIHLGKGYGHFCKGYMGTEEFPELLNEIVQKWPIFTTRPDTLFGVTFMVISAQHPQLMNLITDKQKKQVEKFLTKVKSTSEKNIEELEKQGVFTGSYSINPITNEKIPIWVGNFVVADYGSGMVMAVPAHDQRDFEFAKKYKLPIKGVIKGEKGNINERAYIEQGKLINSGKFNGLNNEKAKKEITKYLKDKKLAKETTQYKLKDWLISRQRYWGTPIPIVYCDKCGIVPIPEKQLPVKLPEKVKFGKGNPLLSNKNFVNVKCPKCKGKARRETDTMDTFVNSSWYFLRYADPKNRKKIFEKKRANYWMPVDQYIGGAEHACMHLIYARFYNKFLRDLGLIKSDEPFIKLFNQGMLHGPDGAVMSKSRGNVVLPEKVSKKYGIDTARLFLVSTASPDKDVVWSDKGINGSLKFINKVIDYFANIEKKIGKSNERFESKINKTIKKITENIEDFKYNLAVIEIRELFESMDSLKNKEISKKYTESFLKLLHVFCPHITEELWHRIGNKNFISLEKWPVVDEKKINEKFEKEDAAVEKLVGDIKNINKIMKDKQGKYATRAYIYVLPKELELYKNSIQDIRKRTNLKIEIFSVADKKKYDSNNWAKKAKPNKPAIFME